MDKLPRSVPQQFCVLFELDFLIIAFTPVAIRLPELQLDAPPF